MIQLKTPTAEGGGREPWGAEDGGDPGRRGAKGNDRLLAKRKCTGYLRTNPLEESKKMHVDTKGLSAQPKSQTGRSNPGGKDS